MAVPKFEDFKAPWETDAQGNPIAEDAQVVDKALLKKWAHNLLLDKDKAQTGRDTNASKIGELTAQIETLKAAAPEGGAVDSSNPEIKKLMDLVKDMSEKAEKAELQSTKVTVLTTKGLDPVADMAFFAKLSTAEEIEAMADTLVERGLAKKKEAGKEGEEGQELGLDGKPVQQFNNGTPPSANDGELKVSVTDFLAGYQSGNPLF